jgi:DNA-directed RNA polymerase alpha subunit
MKITLHFDSMEEFDAFCEQQKAMRPKLDGVGGTPIGRDEDLPLRLKNALKAEGILTVEQAMEVMPRAILTIPNCGHKAMNQFMEWKEKKLGLTPPA